MASMESPNGQASIAKSTEEETVEGRSCDNLRGPAKALCSEGSFDSRLEVEEFVSANILKSEKQVKMENLGEKNSLVEIYPPMMAPSASSTDAPVAGKVLVDYHTKDYRGFIFVLHENHGLMLLHCTRKKSKPPHWQLPGGHVDNHEFLEAARQSNVRNSQLLLAGKAGAARELFEETGVDVRSQLERLQPAALRDEVEVKNGVELLNNEFKHRLFFFLTVTDADFLARGRTPMGTEGRHLKVKLSIEHSGFTFQPNLFEAAEMLKHHSGGKCTDCLLKAIEQKPSVLELFESSSVAASSKPSALSTTAASPTSPGTRRRSKYDRSIEPKITNEPVDLLSRPEKKSTFCCFGC